MSQIFHTPAPTRWKRTKIVFRVLFFLLLLIIAITGVSFFRKDGIISNKLILGDKDIKDLLRPEQPVKLNDTIQRVFSKSRDGNDTLSHSDFIHSAFFVNWDPQAQQSLKAHANDLDMVYPEWFFLRESGDSVEFNIDTASLTLMKNAGVKIVPILSNYFGNKWNKKSVLNLLNDPKKQEEVAASLIRVLRKYKLDGINIDFEDMNLKSDEPLVDFTAYLFAALHKENFQLSIDIIPLVEDYDLKSLAAVTDYIVVMAYDEHFTSSTPGPLASAQWVESIIQMVQRKGVPDEKIVLGLGCYGYDWADGKEAETLTYNEAIALAAEQDTLPLFDNNNYNVSFQYRDGAQRHHQVWFTDAATTYNLIRTAYEYDLHGVAIWRLGSEDERIWQFYKNNLSSARELKKNLSLPPIEYIKASDKVDFLGEGEILDLLTKPGDGSIKLEYDTTDLLISEEYFIKLPTRYTIKRAGIAKPKKILLSFDDGPDPDYTPQIIKILKAENIPAAFFIIGRNAASNVEIVRELDNNGFEIGNHTFTHPNLAEVGPLRARNEINATQRIIETITGHSTKLFRPPFNADIEPTTAAELVPIAVAKELGLVTVGESIDTRDWESEISAEKIIERIKKQENLGAIILLHDGGGNRSETVKALPEIIKYFKSKGYEFISLSEMMEVPREQLFPLVKGRKENMLLGLNYDIILSIGRIETIFIALFFLSIVLVIARTIFIAILAFKQKRKSDSKAGNIKVNAAQLQSRGVSIIVPAFNEEVNAVKTILNLLSSDYPVFEIIFVDDGSKDRTLQLVTAAFQGNQKVRIITKQNAGKAAALNSGIDVAAYDYVLCIDADTILKFDALQYLMTEFNDPDIDAVSGNVKVGNEINAITKWQSIEYITSQNFDRRALTLVNAVTVIPGAIGAFKKSAIARAGGFTSDTLAEDCDITIRILKNFGKVAYCSNAIAYTEAPESTRMFLRQRFRWTFGIMQNWWKHRDLFFNPEYKWLGLFTFPNMLLFQMLIPLLSPIADFYFLLSIIFNPDLKIVIFYGVFTFVDFIAAFIAFNFEKENKLRLIWLIPQRIIYRQYLCYALLKSYFAILKGSLKSWGIISRTGNVAELTPEAIA